MTTHDFQKGDRVQFDVSKAHWNLRQPDRVGTVQSVNHWKGFIRVLWDGRKTGETYHAQYLQIYQPNAERQPAARGGGDA